MTVGRSYTVTGWVNTGAAVNESERLTIAGGTAPSYAIVTASTWTQLSYQFTATATSATLQLQDGTGAASGYLLLADDVGLGKTIEAGLVLQELLLRHRARTAVIVCPPRIGAPAASANCT